ncbi:Malonate-semialdehyde dehydrogenase [Paraburkholderia ultramafica]|uniref:Malonate-semialdehyde dehydrogenase n=1 Tax=Paraburkholderia ultramafica TaxID=1544867 RepID=A0A6S7B5Q6_9BURK|nr:Malonate-semialdehyde dehydrogenase [Paraburkholderia ultramafica]
MQHATQFYIDGQWVDPVAPADQTQPATLDVIDPSTANAFAKISLGSAADVDRAVAAAKRAFAAYSETTIEQRIDLLQVILDVYRKRRACTTSARPNSVNATPLALRTTSGACRSASSSRIALVTAAGESPRERVSAVSACCGCRACC